MTTDAGAGSMFSDPPILLRRMGSEPPTRAVTHLRLTVMDAIAYIDGLNFYYGAIRNRPNLKWLNPQAMLESIFPELQIRQIRYFSTLVLPQPDDLEAPRRQAVYFRALRTIPALTIYEGRMAVRTKTGIVLPKSTPPQVATLEVFEEKRTDVNIASHLLLDAFENRYHTGVIVSNDSDLTTPIEMVVGRLSKTIITVNPYRASRQSSELRRAATRTIS